MWCEAAQRRRRERPRSLSEQPARRRVESPCEAHPLRRVVGGQVARDHERPSRSTAWRAARGRRARVPRAGRRARHGCDGAQLSGARGEGQLGHGGRVPGGEVLARSPRWTGASSRAAGSTSSMPSDTVTSRTPCASASSSTARSQAWPSYHQWPSSSVSSAKQSRPPPASLGGARARSRVRARGRARARPRGRTARRRCSTAAGRGRCGPSSCGSAVRRVAVLVAPDELRRTPSRSGRRPGRPVARRQVVEALHAGLVDAEARTPWSASSRSSPGT